MSMRSRTEEAKQRLKNYKNQLRNRLENGIIIPEIDEKGLYYALKYDYDHGRLLDPTKLSKFKELGGKYGKN